MIKDKIKLFTYYDFEFKRNFVLNELNRVLDNKLNELGISASRKFSLKDKVDMIDLSINSKTDRYFCQLYMDLHKCLEKIENREISFKDMYISNIDKEYYYRKNLRMNLFPAFRYDEKGVSSVFTSYYVSDKNMVLAYIEVYESKLVEIRKYYKSKALKLK